MKSNLLKLIALILALGTLLSSLVACDFIDGVLDSVLGSGEGSNEGEGEKEDDGETEEGDDPITGHCLNGVPLDDYYIVYDSSAPDYNKRAAEYISNAIYEITGLDLRVTEDVAVPKAHEIVVGETNRPISDSLNENTEDLEFAILAEDGHIALEGDYFVIAAAAYYFVYTYITDKALDIIVPEYPVIHEPIVEKANNYILLIGDGMGVNQTKLFEYTELVENTVIDYSDGEDIFYGYLLPYYTEVGTRSLNGVTDSAAAATALASGYKTNNRYVGKDKDFNNVTSITELCGSLGMATAVLSTDKKTGATPSGFSAHADNRDNKEQIILTQFELSSTYGTIINCNYDYYTADKLVRLENMITGTLDQLSQDEDGFFLMYEEAYIDKHCSADDIESAYESLVRFNLAIGRFMEFCFYNPDTMLIITADHETGDLHIDENGDWVFTSEDHTDKNVPLFAWGDGAEIFDGVTIENVQIPKTIASMLGVDEFGDMSKYPSLYN